MTRTDTSVTVRIGSAIRPDDIRIPALTTREFGAWLVGTAAATIATAAVIFVTQPEHRVGALVGASLAATGFAALGWRSCWFDPQTSSLVVVRWRSYRRRVPLRPGTEVVLISNRAGVVLLGARCSDARRRLYVPVLRLDQYVERSLDPEVLRLLADAVERGRAAGGRAVARHLRDQAAHGAAGGDARTSPLSTVLARPTRP